VSMGPTVTTGFGVDRVAFHFVRSPHLRNRELASKVRRPPALKLQVRSGSEADLTLGARDVGSYLNNGHGARTSRVMEEVGH
jgi:hypothetical protein